MNRLKNQPRIWGTFFFQLRQSYYILENFAWPDIEIEIARLCTRVDLMYVHYWKKIKRVITWLQKIINDVRIIGCDNFDSLFTRVYVLYVVWDNMRLQAVRCMSMLWGMIHAKSVKQLLNTKRSEETETVGVSDNLPYNIHLVSFMKEQGYEFKIKMLFQDNLLDIRIEQNGRNSCTGNSLHVNICYFFEYFPTHIMIADYFTKPLQENAFKLFHDVIMGYSRFDTLLTADIPIKGYVGKGNKIKMIEKSTVPCIKNNRKINHILTYSKRR